jgi:hypothetical protein
MELLIPRRDRSISEVLLNLDGEPTDLTLALRLVRLAETEALNDPGGRLVAQAERTVAAAAQGLFETLREKVGSRVTVEGQQGWGRTVMQVTAR